MIYVYDTVIKDGQKHLKRYGATYRFEKRFRMGDRLFYSFLCPGREKMLVVPEFAEQYRKVESIALTKFKPDKDFDYYLKAIRKYIDEDCIVEQYPAEESATGVMEVVTCIYKDVQVTFEYMNNAIHLANEMTINSHNLFGDGIVVQMNVNTEE